jgi:hypothetical protein
MDDPEEHALVVKALLDGLGHCVIWHDKGARLVREDPELGGLTPAFIRREVIEFVRAQADAAAVVVQVSEQREGWRDAYRFYYKVILPVDGFKHGLFVEMRLTDDDREFPAVTIVRAHVERK